MADNIVTHCKTCGTSWGECEILEDRECAACLRKEVERLRAVLNRYGAYADNSRIHDP